MDQKAQKHYGKYYLLQPLGLCLPLQILLQPGEALCLTVGGHQVAVGPETSACIKILATDIARDAVSSFHHPQDSSSCQDKHPPQPIESKLEATSTNKRKRIKTQMENTWQGREVIV